MRSDAIRSKRKDLRHLNEKDLEGIDTVFHLAALSNDPIGNLNSNWTNDINNLSAVNLAKLSKSAGVKKFIFSSSCIMYGNAETEIVDENTPVSPNTDYALSKVEAEKEIMKLSDDNFAPVSLRNGTVYGFSKYMRFDTVTNDFVGSAIVNGEVIIKGNGAPWRPVVHIEDVCRSFIMISESPSEKINGQIFNNGSDDLNIQIKDLASIVSKIIEGTTIKILSDGEEDQRTYKASFKKMNNFFPDFKFKYNPHLGVSELYNKLTSIGFKKEDYFSKKFIRLKKLSDLIENNILDSNLEWK